LVFLVWLAALIIRLLNNSWKKSAHDFSHDF